MGSRNWLGSCRGFSSTTWHMVILGSVPHSEGGKAFQAFGEQAPQQGSENSSHLICGPKTGWGTSENQRQVLQKGGGAQPEPSSLAGKDTSVA